MGGRGQSNTIGKHQHQHQHQHQRQQSRQKIRSDEAEELSPTASGSGSSGLGGGGGGSRQRTRQMLHSHLAARRSGGSRSGRRQQLQANLYQLLDKRQSNAPTPPLPPRSTSCGGDDHLRRGRLRLQQGQEAASDRGERDREKERRRLLLEAIGTLKRLSTDCCHDDVEDDASGCDVGKSASNSARKTEPPPQPPPPQQAPSKGVDFSEQLRQLSDSLRYLAVACRVRQRRPAATKSLVRDNTEADCRERAELELGQKIGATRDLLADMLRRSGANHAPPSCRARFAPDSSAAAKCDRLFWRCPVHAELEKQRRRQRRPPSPTSLPPLPKPPSSSGRRSRSDAVKLLVSRSKDALIGDQVFNVSCAGKESKWGQMKLPTTSDHIPNSADAMGRANLHRRRTLERRQSALAELQEFTSRVEDKWEAIEATRIDRAIDAACRRLRRLTVKSRRQRRGAGRGGLLDSAPGARPMPAAIVGAPKKAAGNDATACNVSCSSDNGSIHWGV